jgi:hypothetical protein
LPEYHLKLANVEHSPVAIATAATVAVAVAVAVAWTPLFSLVGSKMSILDNTSLF